MTSNQPPDLTAFWRAMVPGLGDPPSTLDKAGRAQAGLAAEALRGLHAPIAEILRRNREFEASLADVAAQLTELAEQIDSMARGYAQLNHNLERAVTPYASYVEQLERYAAGGGERPG